MKVKFENISKNFDGVEVLRNISFEIREGEFFFLLGPSGCGKTTLLRIVAGFEKPSSGRILFNGKDVSDIPPEKRKVGMVFQNYAIWPHMTVFENVAYGLLLRKIEKSEVEKRVSEVLDLVQLRGYEKRYPSQLSGGQQQRVAVARSLVVNPQLLLFDEPLSNLDAKLRIEMRNELKKIQKRSGITSIYVTHDQKEALSMADYLVILNNGKIEQMGKPFDIYNFPKNKFVAGFIGETNFISGIVKEQSESGVVIETEIGEITGISRERFNKGDKVIASIRPHHIKFVGDQYKFKVEDSIFMGEYEYFVLSNGSCKLHMMDFEGKLPFPKSGDIVSIGFSPNKVVILKDE